MVGLVIAAIISWIYDFHPLGGIVRTKPVENVKEEEESRFSNSWKIASYISFAVIAGLIVLNVMARTGRKETIDKSIAILPFHNDSPDQKRMYFINGTMEAILDNLSKIKDMRVVSRNSTEHYRDDPKPTPVVASEMNVSYILEGSGHRDGDHVRIIVQLLDGKKDKQLWSQTYEATIEEIFSLQSQIAQKIADEIEAIITPEEKSLIEKIPTENQTAYDLYMRAIEVYRTDLAGAEELCRLSLEYDSTFTWPNVGLGWIYFTKYNNTTEYQPAYLDSIRKFVNKALLHNDQESGAYNLRGTYYRLLGENDKALMDFNRALELNPNLAGALQSKAWMAYDENNYLGAIENFQKAIAVDRGPDLKFYYTTLSYLYFLTGFNEQSGHYSTKELELSRDTAQYYFEKARIELWFNNDLDRTLEFLEKGYDIDPNNIEILYHLGVYYNITGQQDKSLKYLEQYAAQFNDPGEISVFNKNLIAIAYLKNGFTMNLSLRRSRMIWMPNIRPSMKGSGSGWRRMIVSLIPDLTSP